jgi:Flp pilus assembly pilin Flp
MVRSVTRVLARLWAEDDGQDLIEYALLTALIAVGGALVFPSIRTKMGAAYQSWLSGAQDLWEPAVPTGS